MKTILAVACMARNQQDRKEPNMRGAVVKWKGDSLKCYAGLSIDCVQ